ncbi:MAG: LysR family transcriptional regulator [Stappiaceae bacterium]
MIDLNAMAVFVKVVQAGSFSKAAKQLEMPLSTVSRKVAMLEGELKSKLLERSTRSLRPTEIGTLYYEQCRQAVETINSANLMVENRQVEIEGTLRISVPPSLAETLFVPIIGLFQAHYPKARVAVYISDRIADRVDDGIDLSFRAGPVRDTSLVARRLLTYRHVLIAAPDYLSHDGAPRIPQDLLKRRLIAFGFLQEREKTWTLVRGKRHSRITFEPHVSFNDYDAILRAVTTGQGIAEIPSILCREAIEQGLVEEILPGWAFQEIDFQCVHPGTPNLSRLARLFLDMCIVHIGGKST